jgi:hypothetical protein
VIKVDVRADFKKAHIFLSSIAGANGVKRATARALNRTLTTVRAEAARRLQEERNLRIGEIKKQMRIERATVAKLWAKLTVSGKPISIRHFSRLRLDRANGKVIGVGGITAKIRKADRYRLLRRHGNKAFTNPKIGGGLVIVYRTTKKRLPISAWAPVPGLPRVLVQAKIAEALKEVATSTFKKRYVEELNYIINVAKAKAA